MPTLASAQLNLWAPRALSRELSSPGTKPKFHRMIYPAIEIARLTVGERLELIEQVWDSLRRDTGVLPLTDTERVVIESRRAEHRADSASAVDWETVRADLVNNQVADEQHARSATRD